LNIRESLREMPSQRQDWILGILSDVCGDYSNLESLNKNRLERFYSLGVGPLRTSLSGSIDIDPDDDPIVIIRNHIEDVDPQRYLRNIVFSLEQFVELANDLTERERAKSSIEVTTELKIGPPREGHA